MKPARLGDAVVSMKNGMYKPASDYGDDGVPCLRMYNIDAGAIVWRDIKRMRVTAAELEDYGLREGDLLVNRVNSRELVGKTACIPASLEPSVFESKNIRVRVDPTKAQPKFISYQLLAGGRKHFEGNAQQVVGMASISQKQIADFPIVLGELDDQRRVVAEIEKQFSRLDEAVAGLQRAKANLKRYKAAVLKSAVAGRLVPTEADLARREGRHYETGAQLLHRILETRRSQWQGKGKYKEPAAPDTTDLPELPEGWTWSTADQMCSQITDGEHIQPRYKETGFPMLTAKNVRDGYVDFGDVGYIAKNDFEACLRRCAPVEGDLLIVSVGATTGRSAIVARCKPFALVRSVLLLRPVSAVLPNYILCWLQSPWCQTHIQRASGATAQAHLYIKDTRTIPVPLPPLSEQHRIVAEVDRLLSIAREAEAEVEANLKRAQGLRQAILGRAFSEEIPDMGT